MLRIIERLTLCKSRPSGKHQIRQCCGKAILTPQYSCKLCNIRQTQAVTYVCSGSKRSQTLITYAQVEKPMLNSYKRAGVF